MSAARISTSSPRCSAIPVGIVRATANTFHVESLAFTTLKFKRYREYSRRGGQSQIFPPYPSRPQLRTWERVKSRLPGKHFALGVPEGTRVVQIEFLDSGEQSFYRL